MGGYADDLFNLFYRMEPRLMVAEGFVAGTAGRRDFATRYGVMESIEKIPDQDNACTRTAKSDVRLVRKPGTAPLVFGKFLMASTAFVTLDDIADYLPSYEESVIEVEMDDTLGRAYEHVEKDIREAVAANRGNRSLMSLMMHRSCSTRITHSKSERSGGNTSTRKQSTMSPSWSPRHQTSPKRLCIPRSAG
jgi:hypothetical protein